MINSRDVKELVPVVRKKAEALIAECKNQGVDIIITSTYRDIESQDALYAQGRTAPGKIVTKVKGGQSIHNWRCAFDVVPLVNGKAVWSDSALWSKIGKIGTSLGLDWGGNWQKFKDKPHFQYTGGLNLYDLQKGLIPNGE